MEAKKMGCDALETYTTTPFLPSTKLAGEKNQRFLELQQLPPKAWCVWKDTFFFQGGFLLHGFFCFNKNRWQQKNMAKVCTVVALFLL